jgi:hypothetical protein
MDLQKLAGLGSSATIENFLDRRLLSAPLRLPEPPILAPRRTFLKAIRLLTVDQQSPGTQLGLDAKALKLDAKAGGRTPHGGGGCALSGRLAVGDPFGVKVVHLFLQIHGSERGDSEGGDCEVRDIGQGCAGQR